MSLDASAKNMQAVCKAKEHHDKTCPWGGKGTHVHLSWFDIERMGWEEGDVICGLTVVADGSVATGMMRVTCDAEPDGGKKEEEEVDEVVDAVSERELVTVGPGAAPVTMQNSTAGSPSASLARAPAGGARAATGGSATTWDMRPPADDRIVRQKTVSGAPRGVVRGPELRRSRWTVSPNSS